MKIGISANGKNKEDLLEIHFGRCEYFQVYDLESNTSKVVENKGILASGGAGIAAANQMIDEGIDVIISGSLGPNAFKLISKAGIKSYKCDEIPIKDVLIKYSNNDLEEIKSEGKPNK